MKARKARAYRVHVRAQLAAGLVNHPSGNWVSFNVLDAKPRRRAELQAARMGAGK